MPATITHAYFAEDLFNRFDDNIKRRIDYDKKMLMMFSQSTDALMFYNIYSVFPGKKYRALQLDFHENNTNLFFSYLINYMKKKKYYNDPFSLSFLYGFIAHFCLDSNCHPYVFYRTGKFVKNDKSTYKYKSLHTYMEAYIDNFYIKSRNYSKNIKLSDFCFDEKKFSKELNDVINYSFLKVFNVKNMDKIYYKSLIQMKRFISLFMFDKYGFKKKLYMFIDLFTPKSAFCLKSLSYHLDNYEKLDYLNNNHKKWYYPVDKKISSCESFLELYEKSLKECIFIIDNVNKYFFEDKKIDIDSLFHNRSYVTGIDCNSKLTQKFFEF